MAEIYLSQYRWAEVAPGLTSWHFPGNPIGQFGMRSVAQKSLPGGSPEGFGFVVYDSPEGFPEIEHWFGNDINRVLTNAERTLFQRTLGAIPSPGVTIAQAIGELTRTGDPSGQTRWKPKPCTREKGFTVRLAPFGIIYSEPWQQGHQGELNRVAQFQYDYARHRVRGDYPLDIFERWVGAKCLSLRGIINDSIAAEILPPGMKTDRWKVPSTVLSDDFETDTSADWTANSGSLTIDNGNNGFMETGGDTSADYNTDQDSDEHFSEYEDEGTSGSSYRGPAARSNDDAANFVSALKQAGDGNVQIFEQNSGSFNGPLTNDADSLAAGALYQLRIDSADDYLFYRDGSLVNSVDDGSPITGNLTVGIYSNSTASNYESWNSDTLGGAPPAAPVRRNFMLMGVGR